MVIFQSYVSLPEGTVLRVRPELLGVLGVSEFDSNPFCLAQVISQTAPGGFHRETD